MRGFHECVLLLPVTADILWEMLGLSLFVHSQSGFNLDSPAKNKHKRVRLMPNVECSVSQRLISISLTELCGKAACIVCGEHVAVFKDYNLGHHFETKHKKCRHQTNSCSHT